MKKILTLNLIVICLFGFQINAEKEIINPTTIHSQNGDVSSKHTINESKGFFADRQERFKAKRLGKKRKLEEKLYIEPKRCSLLTTVCASIGSFITGLFVGFGILASVLYGIFHV